MSLFLMNWGGQIYDSQSAGVPVEIWSNTLALIGTDAEPDPADVTALSGLLTAWFGDADTGISQTVRLEFLKVNAFDVVTGLQITDPTIEVSYLGSNVRGGITSDNSVPLTSSYRVSLDDGTRDKRSKGGFFVPRPIINILYSGRWEHTSRGNALGSTMTLLEGINALDGITVGVWSRVNHGVTAVSRVRVGDVPDNIRRRKNALREDYAIDTLS